ncbi:MAG: aldo/keto reductase [Candidatus Eremiobacteraeota bacterium]|nr:aldo/keto reductase [Candidatus Eremiobacteraeota bacterium]
MAVDPKATAGALGGEITIGGDLTVRRMGFGAMRITGKGIWGPPPDWNAAVELVRHVVASGVNFIDTADSYGPGCSEEIIAEALAPYPQDVVIATKGGLTRTGPDQWPIDARPERLRASCEASLRRLGLERIDLYQLHRIDPKVPVEESLGALVDLQREGKVRHIGVSQTSVDEYERCKRTATIASVQNLFNVGDRSADSVLRACERDGIAFLPWFPLGGEGQPKHAELQRIAKARGASPAQIALAWLLARSPAIVPIPGTSSRGHFDENLAAGEITLTNAELAALA